MAEAGWPVRVWTAALPQQTTSVVAGAVWAPPRPAERAAETLAWTEHSLKVFRELADDPGTGVRMAPALVVGELTAADSMASAAWLIPDLQPAEPADTSRRFYRRVSRHDADGRHAAIPRLPDDKTGRGRL